MSCNFRQPLAGVGDLSSSQPSSSSASASYLWPPSKVNMLPQVQINSTLTKGLPLLLHLSTSTHTSPTTGEIRASLADLTAPQNTAPDRSLIAWLDPLSTPQCTHTHVHTHHKHCHHHYHPLSLPLAKSTLLYSAPFTDTLLENYFAQESKHKYRVVSESVR